MKARIQEVEEKLRLAMLASDVAALDELLSPRLIFTNHFGMVIKKQDDLAAHESGLVKISEIKPSEQQIELHSDIAVVSVRVQISGSFAGSPANGDFRFTRVWAFSVDSDSWQLIAGHSSTVS